MDTITKCSITMMSTWSELLWILPYCPVVATVVGWVVSLGYITVTWVALVPAMTLDIVRTISSVERHGTSFVIHLKISSNVVTEQSVHLCFWIRLEIS